MKIGVYGNCQAPVLSRIFEASGLEVIHLPAVYTIADRSNQEPLLALIRQADVILHHPISDAFGLSCSTGALRTAEPSKTWVSMSPVHFDGFCPQLRYMRLPKGGTLIGPLGDYHDWRIAESYLASASQAACVAAVDGDDQDYVVEWDQSVREAENRDATVDIPVHDLVFERGEREAVTYTFNHPTISVLNDIAARALAVLGIKHQIVGLTVDPLNDIQAAIPGGVGRRLPYSRPHNIQYGKVRLTEELVASAYAKYDTRADFADIVAFNLVR